MTIAQTCAPAPVGLISWYPAEGNALDSRSDNHGTLQNGATFAAGQNGQAFNLDGTDDFIRVSTNANLRPNVWTLETWVNPRALRPTINGFDGVITQGSATGFGDGFFLGFRNERVYTAVTHNAAETVFTEINSTASVPLNQWSHLASTFDGNNLKLYVNGVLTDTVAANSPLPFYDVNSDVLIGADTNQNSPGVHFNGLVDEPAIYNRALSAAEILQIANAGTAGKCKPTATVAPGGQVAWLAGDGDTRDISGNNNNGAFVGGSSFAVGKVGQDFNFNGGQSVQVPDNATLDFTNALTIEMWVNPSVAGSSGGDKFFISKGVFQFVGTQSYGIGFDVNRRIFFRVGNGSAIDTVVSTSQLPLDTFTHIAATYDGTALRIYINGVLDAPPQATSIGTLFNSADPLYIGGAKFSGSDILFPAAIDEASLYNRALTDAEITSVFNAGIAGKLKTIATPTGFSAADSKLRNFGLKNDIANFSPQSVSVTVGDAIVTFQTVTSAGETQEIPLSAALFPPLTPIAFTGLMYDVATSATFTGNPTVCFNLPSFTPAQFAGLRIYHLENGIWRNRTAATNTFPTLCTAGLASLSPFAIVQLQALAASVPVGGRVLSTKGDAISKARVSLTDPNGETRTALTNAFGYYRFENVEVGRTYVLSAAAKRYQFEPQSATVMEESDDLDFTAEY